MYCCPETKSKVGPKKKNTPGPGSAGNSHMRFYDVTSWNYVNLDDSPGELSEPQE